MATSRCLSTARDCGCGSATTTMSANSLMSQGLSARWNGRPEPAGLSSVSNAIGQMSSRTDDLVWIPGQTATLGSERHYPEEAPVRDVSVDGFWIQPRAVTNAEFALFVDDTGYLTVAERPVEPDDYPGAPVENLQPGSMVFTRTTGPVD